MNNLATTGSSDLRFKVISRESIRIWGRIDIQSVFSTGHIGIETVEV